MIFEANPGYIFHDSRGFECGSTEEFKIVQDFIKWRGMETASQRQLHAIWYCLPTDNASRLLTGAEARFFQECDPGAVPVIVIYTKFDDFVLQTQQFLTSHGWDEDDAFDEASRSASNCFTEEYAKVINETKFPPSMDVQLQDMDKPDTNCGKLLEKTTDALDDDALRQLLVCIQKNNLDLCGKWGVKSWYIKGIEIKKSYFLRNVFKVYYLGIYGRLHTSSCVVTLSSVYLFVGSLFNTLIL
ncbi:hypothetical protein JAAARDRAFT_27893 [Jaapia argillacea MUCL 33604]|uniref:G domain-containing protein n=1 Tax=Jaapia argillacea MUCL 33604 TaxID=933084 RepID=A0A067QNQ1_9AGAM|nr:hypothetical protein JAAARDRAFT_27893 [Jaapia argillacea MUCL 33604]